MTIKTLDKSYQVIGYGDSDASFKRYVCREEGDRQVYELISVSERRWVDEMLPFFLTCEGKSKFSDYHGLFVQDECLFLVFSYREGQTLGEKLNKQQCTRREREALFSSVLEKLMLLAMPEGIAADVLSMDQILASDAGEIDFRYELSDPARVLKNDRWDMQESLLSVYDGLFEEEIRRRTVLPLLEYRDRILPGNYDELIEIYRLFRSYCHRIDGLPREETEQPRTKPYLLWAGFKRAFPVIRTVLILIIMLGAIGFFVWTVRIGSKDETREDVVIHQIGTYELDDVLKGR